jgi:hypothetical protein
MKEQFRHVAWGCRKCNKIDWVDNPEQMAKPEHVSHRGIDIGSCGGEFIKLFVSEEMLDEADADAEADHIIDTHPGY